MISMAKSDRPSQAATAPCSGAGPCSARKQNGGSQSRFHSPFSRANARRLGPLSELGPPRQKYWRAAQNISRRTLEKGAAGFARHRPGSMGHFGLASNSSNGRRSAICQDQLRLFSANSHGPDVVYIACCQSWQATLIIRSSINYRVDPLHGPWAGILHTNTATQRIISIRVV
jgi:hypothetical protein